MITALVFPDKRVPLGLPLEEVSLEHGDSIIYLGDEYIITRKCMNFDNVSLEIFVEKKSD